MTSTSLTSPQDQPTHKLTVKLEDGTFRTFYLTAKEAEWMARNINSVEPNIVLPQSIDPNAPSFYPKRGASMERMTADELQARRARYVRPAADPGDEVRKERTKQVIAWMQDHPADFEAMLTEAERDLEQGGGFYKMASKGTRSHLVRFQAMSAVHSILFPTSQNGQ